MQRRLAAWGGCLRCVVVLHVDCDYKVVLCRGCGIVVSFRGKEIPDDIGAIYICVLEYILILFHAAVHVPFHRLFH